MTREDLIVLDLNPKHGVQVQVSNNGVVWVNVDGLLRLRASNCPRIEVEVDRMGQRPRIKQSFNRGIDWDRRGPDFPD